MFAPRAVYKHHGGGSPPCYKALPGEVGSATSFASCIPEGTAEADQEFGIYVRTRDENGSTRWDQDKFLVILRFATSHPEAATASEAALAPPSHFEIEIEKTLGKATALKNFPAPRPPWDSPPFRGCHPDKTADFFVSELVFHSHDMFMSPCGAYFVLQSVRMAVENPTTSRCFFTGKVSPQPTSGFPRHFRGNEREKSEISEESPPPSPPVTYSGDRGSAAGDSHQWQ